ncbi:30S ribosomal protein S6 [Patescibacteria group bacterium]
MKKYEIIYIVPSKYTDAEMEGVVGKVSGILKEAGAEISDTYQMGKRRLAYPIDRQRTGSYVLSHFEAEPEAVAKIDAVLRLTGEVLRHMTVERDPHLTQMPSFNEVDERRTEERPERREREKPMVQAPAKPAAKADVNMEDLDKKLDQILTEEVL